MTHNAFFPSRPVSLSLSLSPSAPSRVRASAQVTPTSSFSADLGLDSLDTVEVSFSPTPVHYLQCCTRTVLFLSNTVIHHHGCIGEVLL